MTGHSNGNSDAHFQGGWQLDLAGCAPVDDSIQVWRPVVGLNGMSTPPHLCVFLTSGNSLYLV